MRARMTITVTVSDKKTATSRPENNALVKGKRRITEHKRRGKECAQAERRMCTRWKKDVHKEEREYACSAIEGKRWAEKLKRGSETLLPGSCFRTS